jgi:hypothetical protein
MKLVFDSNQDERWLLPRSQALGEFTGKEMGLKEGYNTESPREFLHLQAADLYAYAMRQTLKGSIKKAITIKCSRASWI